HLLEKKVLAVCASNSCCSTTLGGPLLPLRSGEYAMMVKHRADIRIARISPSNSGRIRDHRHNLFADAGRIFRKLNLVAVALAQLATMRTRQTRCGGQLGLRFRKNRTIEVVEAPGHFSAQFDVRNLILPDRNLIGLVYQDIGGLQQRISKESVS